MPSRLAGWFWNGEKLAPTETINGAFHRHMAVQGKCRLEAECSRRVSLQVETLVKMGLGHLPIAEVCRFYHCQRRPLCEMTWLQTYQEGVPLQMALSVQNVTREFPFSPAR